MEKVEPPPDDHHQGDPPRHGLAPVVLEFVSQEAPDDQSPAGEAQEEDEAPGKSDDVADHWRHYHYVFPFLPSGTSAVTRQLITVTNTTVVNTETMCELLRKMAALGMTGPITLVLDNARCQHIHGGPLHWHSLHRRGMAGRVSSRRHSP